MEDKNRTPEYEEYDATLEPDLKASMSDDELQESILEDSDLNGFQKAVARMSEKTWTLVQRIVGALLGIASGAALFWNGGSNDQNGFSYSLIVAVVLAMLVPNILEKQCLRRINKLRIALVIALGVVIVAYFIYFGSVSGFKFTNG